MPNLLAAAMLVAFLTALQTQVRLVEEPYLHRVHGTVYDQYAARTGRFLPWIGRQRTGTGPAEEQPRESGASSPRAQMIVDSRPTSASPYFDSFILG